METNKPKGWTFKRQPYKKAKPVILTKIETGEELEFESGKAAARFLGCDQMNITNVATGKNRQVHGYEIRYKHLSDREPNIK